MPYGTVPPEVEQELRRQRLLEALAAMAGGLGTGRLGSTMLQGVAGANRNYQGGIADYLDQQMRRDREERLMAREDRYEARDQEQMAREAEERTRKEAALAALSERLRGLTSEAGPPEPGISAQIEAGVQMQDVGGLNRMLGGLEERRKMMALGISPDDPASLQRYLIDQGVDAAPAPRLTPDEELQNLLRQHRALRAEGLGQYEPSSAAPKEDPLLVQARSAVARELAAGLIEPGVAANRIGETYQALKRGQEIATGARPPGITGPGDLMAPTAQPGADMGRPVEPRAVYPRRTIGTSEGPATGGAEPVLVEVLARYPQADEEFDIEGMRRAGYSDQDIARLLEQNYAGGR